MPVVDASVWVAYYHPKDPGHEQCFAWVTAALVDNERLIAPTLVLAEVAAAITRLNQPEAALEAVENLISSLRLELIPLDEARARRAAEVAAATGVRGADSVYLALARDLAHPLITLDRQQRDRGRAVAEVRAP